MDYWGFSARMRSRTGYITACCTALIALAPAVASAATPANLVVTTTAPGAVATGQTVAFTAVVANAGGTAVTAPVSVTFSLYGTDISTVAAAGSGWTCAAQTNVCTTDADVAPGAKAPTLTATATARNALTNYSQAYIQLTSTISGADNSVPEDDQSSAMAPLVLSNGPDLVASTRSSGATRAGQAASFKAVVRNVGSAAATSPVEVNFTSYGQANGTISGTGSGWTCPTGAGRCTTDADVAAGASLPELTLSVPSASGLHSGSGSQTVGISTQILNTDDRVPENNGGYASSPLVAVSGVDLIPAVRSTGPPASGSPGQFKVSVRNVGTATATSSVEVRLNPGGGANNGTFTASGSGWICPAGADRCTTNADVTANSTLPDITVNTPTNAGLSPSYATTTLTATTISPDDGVPDNDSVYASAGVRAGSSVDLAVDLDSSGSAIGGQAATFTARIRNLGGSTATGRIEIQVSRSGNTSGPATISGAGWTCLATTDQCFTDADVAAGAMLPPLTVAVPTFANSTPITQTTVSLSSPDDALTPNNQATASRGVGEFGRLADLVTTITDNGPLRQGEAGTISTTVTNVGGASADGAVVRLTSPFGGASAAGAGWTCTSTLVCTYDATIAAGDSTPPIVTSYATPTRDVFGQSSADADVDGPADAYPNNDYAYLTPNTGGLLVDLTTTLGQVGPWRLGEPGSFTTTVNNTGTISASDIVVQLDAPYPGARASGSGWTCTTSNLTCAHPGPVAPGTSLPAITTTFTTATRDQLDTRSASARVDAPGDAFSSNDYASASGGIGGPLVDVVATLGTLGPWRQGESSSFTTTVTNAAQQAAGKVVVHLQAPFNGATASGSGWTCTTTLVCSHPGPIAGGASLPVLTTTSDTPQSDTLEMRSVSADLDADGDVIGGNDLTTGSGALGGPTVDVVPVLSTDGAWRQGDVVTFKTKVSNLGSEATPADVSVALNAPANAVATGDGWSCTADLHCRHDGPLGAGQSLPDITTTIQLRGEDSATRIGVSAVVSNTADQVSANNYGTLVVPTSSTSGPPQLRVHIARPSSGNLGSTPEDVTVSVRNAGSDVVPGPTQLRLTPSTSVVIESVDGLGWTCDAEFACVRALPIEPGTSAGLTVRIRATAQAGTNETLLAGVRASDGTSASAVLRLPNTTASGVDLIAATRATGPTPAGQRSSFVTTIRNVGADAATARISVRLMTSGAATDAPRGSGPGWRCPDGADRCVTDADVPGGGELPPLTVTLGTAADRSTPAYAQLSAIVESADDKTADNNTAAGQSPIVARTGVDLVATTGADGPTKAGEPASFTTTVRNVGGADKSGAIELSYSFSGDTTSDPVVVTGSGWECPAGSGRCVHETPLAAGASTPPLTLTAPTPAGLPSSSAYVRLSAQVNSDGDDFISNNSSSASTPIVAASGIDFVPSVEGVTPAKVHANAAFLVHVRNTGGAVSSTPVEIRLDTYGTALTSVSGSGWNCPRGSARCIATATVPAGATLPDLNVQVAGNGTQSSAAGLSATVNSTEDAVTENNGASASVPHVADTYIDLTSAVRSAGPVPAGADHPFVLTVRNSGTQTATQRIEARFSAPSAGTTTASGSGWVCPTGSARCITDTDVAAGAVLPPLTIVSAGGNPGDVSTELSSAEDTTADNNSASTRGATAQLGRLDDLALTVVASPRRMDEASQTTTTVANLGSADHIGPVTVQVYLPYPNLVTTGTGWTCELASGPRSDCTHPGPLAAGATLPVLTTALPPVHADDISIRMVSANVDDVAYPDNNSGYAYFGTGGQQADLTVATTAFAPARPDTTATADITVSNAGGVSAAGPIRVRISPPFNDTTASGTGWSCATSPLVCEHAGPLASGQSLPPVTLQTTVSHTSAISGASFSVTVEGDADSFNTNNYATSSLTRGGPMIDLSPRISTSGPWRVGEQGTFTTLIRNSGTVDASGTVTVQLSAPYPGASADGNGWACTSTLICEHPGPVTAGQDLPPLVTTMAVPARDRQTVESINATVSSSDDDFSANDSQSATVGVGGPPVDVTMNLSTLGAWNVGENATYTAKVVNSGTDPATGKITVTMSAPFSGADGTGDGWTCTTNLACEHDGPLAPGASLPDLNISFPVPAGQQIYSRSATGSVANDSDSYTANNSASLTTGFGEPVAGRRAALYDAEADRQRVALGADARMTVRFLEGLDPNGAQLSVRLPAGLSLASTPAVEGLSNQQSQPAGNATLVTWDVNSPATPPVAAFTIHAAANADLGARTIQTTLTSPYTVEPESDDVSLPVVAPSVVSFLPSTVGRATGQALEVSGTDLSDDYTWELRDGATHVPATSSGGTTTARSLTFDTTGFADGTEPQLVVLSGSTVVATASTPVKVVAAVYRDPEVSVVGPTRVRINTPTFYYVSVTNPSNATVREVPIVISVPEGVELRPEQDGGRELLAEAIARLGSSTTPADIRLTPTEVAELQAELPDRPSVITDPDTHRSMSMTVVPSLPAGGTARVKVAVVPHQLSTGPVVATVPVNRNIFASSGYVSNTSRATAVYAATGKVPTGLSAQDCQGIENECAMLDAQQKNLDDIRGFAGGHLCSSFSSITFGFIGGNCSLDVVSGGKRLLGKKFPGLGFLNSLLGPLNLIKGLFDLSDRIEGRMDDVRFGVTAVDPNDKLSPAGSGDQHFISGDEAIPYTIRFENMASAEAPAQKVLVTDTLPAALNPATARIVGAEVGGTPVNLDAGSTLGDIRSIGGAAVLDALSGRAVELHTTIDVTGSKISASFQGPPDLDDPFAPTPFADFLPPTDETGRGEGSITLQVEPDVGLPTGTEIRNTASIIFDPHTGGPTIATPPAINTLDRTAPTASLPSLPATAKLPYALPITASDVGSGVKRIVVTPTRDGEALDPVEITGNSTSFPVSTGAGRYSFAVEVTDGVGRKARATSGTVTLSEPDPVVPDAPTGGGQTPSTPSGPATPPAAPPTATPKPGLAKPAAVLITAPASTKVKGLRKGITLKLANLKPGSAITLTVQLSGRKLTTAKGRANASGKASLKLKLTKKQLKKLKTKPKLGLRYTVVASNGAKQTLSTTLKVT